MSYPARNERNHALIRDVLDGATLDNVAMKYGITRQRAQQIVSRAGIKVRALRKAQITRAAREAVPVVAELWARGLTIEEVVSETGLRYSTVNAALKILPDSARNARKTHKRTRVRRPNIAQRAAAEELMITRLKALASYYHRTPGMTLYNKFFGKNTSQNVVLMFGSWRLACEAAGLKPNTSPQGFGVETFSEQQIRDAFTRITTKIGHAPTLREWDDNRIPKVEPSGATIRRRREVYESGGTPGSWPAAVAFFTSHLK